MIYKLMSYFMSLLISLSIVPAFSDVTPVNKTEKPRVSCTADVTVMTYNVKVSGVGKYKPARRAPYVIETVTKNKPDSVGFQEVSEDWYDWLKEGLEDYACAGEARNGDGTGEASPVFYRKDKYKCTDSGTFWLSETPGTASKGWDARYRRVCTFVVLQNIKTGFKYVHFNAHFDHIGTRARNESVALVTKKIAEEFPDIPVVFTGDLNDEEGSTMYERILESGMRDTKYLAKVTEDTPTFHGYSAITEMTRKEPIDFIFVNAYCKGVKSYEVLTPKFNGIYSSDHHPVKVMMTLADR